MGTSDWTGIVHGDFSDLNKIRARLQAGADPLGSLWTYGSALHEAAKEGSPELVALLVAHVRDGELDGLNDGRSALWEAVFRDRSEIARVLVEAGADPWLDMMDGWSPGRLALAGPHLDLFGTPPEGIRLSAGEQAMADAGPQLAEVFSGIHYDGYSLLCVAGVGLNEAFRRLDGAIQVDAPAEPENWEDLDLSVVGLTSVPGGCVITQPWAYAADNDAVAGPVTIGTFGYGMYANPKSGNQGSIWRNGQAEAWDLHPGYDPRENSTAREVLASYVCEFSAIAHCMVYAGLSPNTSDCLESPQVWVRMPNIEG
ncbi:ankyrin repeat domain-containing protein [Actinomadura fulvescens]|uniref:ankyrin repeat domain-containing protein n=1 Tax=Actinomadura fulvescens TaxID=46160 RepID=UPI0031DC50B2